MRSVADRAKKIRLFAMDVDGVLTSGDIIVLNSGEEVKVWNVKDRFGFALLKKSKLPIKLAWITARKSRQVRARAEEIGIDFLFQKCPDKWKALNSCLKRLGISPEEAAYMGDDLIDLRPLRKAGLSVCPPDSPDILKKICHYRTKTRAGEGAVREVIEILIKAQGKWKEVASQFMVFLLVSVSVLTGCYSTQKPPLESAEKPDQWVEKFKITETLSGVPVWILDSEIAQFYNKQKKVTMDNIHIQFMNPSRIKGKQSKESLMMTKKSLTQAAYLSAPKGEVKTDSRDLLAWGGVEVQSEDGTKLFAENLLYSTSQQKILTDSPVKVVRRDSILIGEGLEASPDLSTVKIFRHRAEIFPKKIQLK